MSLEGAQVRLPGSVDGIFVGGGHNALVAASYLARCGASTLVLESAAVAGGGLITREITLPLFKHNLACYFSRWTPSYPIWKHLELDKYGLEAVVPEVQMALPLRDGGGLVAYSSIERSVEAISHYSRKDARAYETAYAEFLDLAMKVVGPMRFSAPLDTETRRELLSRSGPGRRYLDLESRAPLDIVREMFEHEVVRSMVLFNIATRAYLPQLDVEGTGYMAALGLVATHGTAFHPGGSVRAARALVASLVDAGGSVVTNAKVARISVENGRATGVELEDGQRVVAKRFVASSLPAAMTLADLVESRHLDPGLRAEVADYRWQEESLFGVYLALREAPHYPGGPDGGDLDQALNYCIGYESSEDLIAHMEAIRAGRTPQPIAFQAGVPSLSDPSMAPPGHHSAFAWHFVPRHTGDGGVEAWDGPAAHELAGAIRERWAEYAPNVETAELAWAVHSPRDLAREVPSMVLGDRHHGSYHPSNFDANRPHKALSAYRTPIEGLYHCGSGTYPGGAFTGQPGHNAAAVIAADHGWAAWWGPRRAEEALADLQ